MFARKMFYALAVIGISAMPHFALAEEAIDPKQIRTITATDATSDCIGDPKTPICAVETFLACSARLDMSLCNKVGISNFSFSERPETVRYRILSLRILKEKDIPKKHRDISLRKIGDTEIVVFQYAANIPACGNECKTTYVIRKVPAGWKIISWAAWGDDT